MRVLFAKKLMVIITSCLRVYLAIIEGRPKSYYTWQYNNNNDSISDHSTYAFFVVYYNIFDMVN